MKPATCPGCGSLWAPRTSDLVAQKTNEPLCPICVWAKTPEGAAALAEPIALEHIAGPAPTPALPTAPESSPDIFSSPTGVSAAPKEVA